MFDFLPDQPAYQFPDLVNVAYVSLWAFFLASLVAITHRLTYRGDHYPNQFFQSVILGSIVTSMIMLAIGDSLARGLGVFGAMAIIRFRTRIDDPRNVLFLFAGLSSGLAVGVYGFTISLVGIIVFCSGAFLLHYSPFRSFVYGHQLIISAGMDTDRKKIDEVLSNYCFEFKLSGADSNLEREMRFNYSVSVKKDKDELIRALSSISGVREARIRILEIQLNA